MSSNYERRGPSSFGRNPSGPGRDAPRPGQPSSAGGGEPALSPDEQRKLEQVICQGDARVIIDWADTIGHKLADASLTTSQIRNVYGTVKQIQLSWAQNPTQAFREAVLLIPKLHYQVARQQRNKAGLQAFERVMVPALKQFAEARDEEERLRRFKNLADFFEAILAYHKKYGGRD